MTFRIEGARSTADWRSDTLGNAVEVNPQRELVRGKEYPFIPMEALSTDSPNVAFIQRRVWDHSSGSRFQNGDVLLARITPSAENGKTALVNLQDKVGFGSTEFIVLSPKKGGIEDSEFLYHLVKFDRIRKQAIQRMTGSTGRQRIPPEALDDILSPIPPVPEQQSIASILSTVDDVIQKTDEIIATTQRLKKGLMQQLLTRGIGHTKFKKTEFGQIPESWDVLRISQLSEVGRPAVKTGPFGTQLKTEHFTSSGVPVINISALGEGRIEKEGLFFVSKEKANELSDYTVRPGDLVFSRVADVGRSIVIASEAEGWIISSNLFRISVDLTRFHPFFLMYSIVGSPVLTRQIVQQTANAGRQIVNSAVLESLVFPIPPFEEQGRIAERISTIQHKIESETQIGHRLRALRKGLRQILLTGKVRVKVN
jgi:type I restriction enzyme S subunit